MSYSIQLENRARKELLRLTQGIMARLSEVIDSLEKEPRPLGSKKLAGVKGYRIRKGIYRILYTINDQNRMVRIYRIGHRKEVYRTG